MTARLTLEYVRQRFENEGYILLSLEYINAHTKLDYICPEGHKHSITWANWARGHRCYFCYGNKPKTIEELRQLFQNEGHTLLTDVYINAHTKLRCICPEGHEYSIAWTNWDRGVRCPVCYGNKPKTIEEVCRSFQREGYILLTKRYINNRQQLDYICSEGHTHRMRYFNWQQGHRCPTCAYINQCGENSSNWRGGKAAEPYCQVWSDKNFKESIKARDGYICMNPLCKRIGTDLGVHHIDYNKKNCHPNNLITLCRSCNAIANFNRDWWQVWYQRIIQIRYGNLTRSGAVANGE